MAELRVTGLGAAVTLRADTPATEALLPRLRRAWSWCLDPAPDAIDAGEVEVFDGADDEEAMMQRLTQRVTQALLTARAGQLFLFHAAALCHPTTGATVVAIAPSGTGKTTLAAAMGRRYDYLTDETAGILDDGRIVAYPKPLSLRQSAPAKVETSPDDLGLVRPAVAARLAAVVLLRREPDTRPVPDVLELPLLDGIAEMAPESSSLYVMQNPLRRLRDLLAPVEPVLQVTYADVSQLDGLVAELVGRP